MKFIKKSQDAVIPSCITTYDNGYDLTVIEKIKDIGEKSTMYDTGIIVVPPAGYYSEIVPKSSLSKTGCYMLANNTGVIDPGYRGTLKIVVTRGDDSLPELEVPFARFQLIFRRICKFETLEIAETSAIMNTERGTWWVLFN